ncbi:hypothetical protein ANME2D_01723 [Candidatus Methanoperedens nitroreducens]|uniref:Uncharacterized protein n=1 Tax=Candidatus Methanoperedens nitratireducens TaxID=1392998 RepID=A0A062V4Q7_9EURY|nr:hypothetical protein ANME2D_01723 [Candidatus Methanoperedens nitroreducens]
MRLYFPIRQEIIILKLDKNLRYEVNSRAENCIKYLNIFNLVQVAR